MYDFGICVKGTARLYINGKLVVSNVENQRSGPSFLGSGTLEWVGEKELVAGRPYKILVHWGCAKTSQSKVPGVVDFWHGGFRFGGCKRLILEESIKKAAALAKTVEQVVVVAG
jgi:beta-glucosidase